MMRLAVLAALISSSTALACTCTRNAYTSEFAASGVAFEGVADGDEFAIPMPYPFTNKLGSVIRVTRVFKGNVAQKVLVTSSRTSCGRSFKRGTTYVFLINPALDDAFGYETHFCDGTAPLANLTTSELAVLGAGSPPTARSPLLAVSVLSVLLTLTGWFAWRLAKKRAS